MSSAPSSALAIGVGVFATARWHRRHHRYPSSFHLRGSDVILAPPRFYRHHHPDDKAILRMRTTMNTPSQPSARHDAYVCVHTSRIHADTAFCVHTYAVRSANSAVFRISYRDALRADSMPIPQNGLFPRISTRAPRYNPHHKRLHSVLYRVDAVQHIKIPLFPQSYRRPTLREPNPCRLMPYPPGH